MEIGFSPHIVAVHPSVPARSVNDLVAYAKSMPGRITYGSSGIGSLTHLATELLLNMAGIKLVHVPYRSVALGLTDLVGGQIQMVVGSMLPTLPHVKARRVNGLAVTSALRWLGTPDIPTVAETLPGYDVVLWFGVWAPKNTPRESVAVLNTAINKAMQEDDVKQQLSAGGLVATGGEPERFAKRIRDDVARWTRVVREAQIKPDS